MTSVEEPARSGERIRDAARTRAEILDVATQEFARAGYDGARVDEIAARTRTTKRMIYYYFGGKEQLFTAVLERAYGVIREAEQELDVDHLDPVAAIRRLAELTFDHHELHPDFIRLVSIENIHEAHHIAGSEKLGKIGSPALDVIRRILASGQESNRHTFGALFGRDLLDGAQRAHYRTMLGDMVIAYLTAERSAD